MIENIKSHIKNIFLGINYSKFIPIFCASIGYSVLPSILTVLALTLINGFDFSFYPELYKRGEYLIYAVSFFSSGMLTIHNIAFHETDSRKHIRDLITILLILTATGYAVVFIMENKINDIALSYISHLMIIIALLFFVLTQFWLYKRSPDIGDIRREEQDTIVDNLG